MVRSFESRALQPEVVERILANAQRGPSAGFSQGWAFLVLEGPEQTRAYWDAVGPSDADAFRWPDLFKAPLLIVCLSNKAAYLEGAVRRQFALDELPGIIERLSRIDGGSLALPVGRDEGGVSENKP